VHQPSQPIRHPLYALKGWLGIPFFAIF